MYSIRLCENIYMYTTFKIYMLFTGWEVHIGKNCAQGFECIQGRENSFSLYGPT